MGTRTLVGHEAGSDKPVWTLFCSVDGHAMGRVIEGDEDDAQAFLDWYEPQWGDPRKANRDTLLERQARVLARAAAWQEVVNAIVEP